MGMEDTMAPVRRHRPAPAAKPFGRSPSRVVEGIGQGRSAQGNPPRKMSKVDDAIGVCHRSAEMRPETADDHNTLGTALKELWNLDEALAA